MGSSRRVFLAVPPLVLALAIAVGVASANTFTSGPLVQVSGASPFAGCTADAVGTQSGTVYVGSEVEPWIDVNPDHVDVNAAAQVDDPGSVFHHYRRLIELRHREPAVVHGDFTMLLPEHPAAYVFTRSYGGVELLVLGNFSGETLRLDLPDGEAWAGAEVLIGNYDAVDDVAELRPWEGRVHRRSV